MSVDGIGGDKKMNREKGEALGHRLLRTEERVLNIAVYLQYD